MAGPAVIGFSESRNDGHPTSEGVSYGFWGAGGVSILMDWVNDKNDWDAYSDLGIKHTYFNIEYAKMTTFPSSPVDFSVSGAYAGIVFEF
jgi:hypothetical protein